MLGVNREYRRALEMPRMTGNRDRRCADPTQQADLLRSHRVALQWKSRKAGETAGRTASIS
jgi:hypothetical protein